MADRSQLKTSDKADFPSTGGTAGAQAMQQPGQDGCPCMVISDLLLTAMKPPSKLTQHYTVMHQSIESLGGGGRDMRGYCSGKNQ